MKPGILKMIRMELAKVVPRFAWGVVTSLTPLTVRLDSHRADAPAIITGVANLAGALVVNQRVCVVQVGGRAMALGPPAPPQPPAPAPRVLSGSVVVAATADTVTNAPVVFPSGFFTAPPAVSATPDTGVPHNVFVGVSTPTTSGFNINLRRTNTAATTVYWTAVQPA